MSEPTRPGAVWPSLAQADQQRVSGHGAGRSAPDDGPIPISAVPSEVYDRQSRIESHGRRWDQAAVTDAAALVVGAGNIGDPLAVALARAGVGRIDIIDRDLVSVPNLSRGISYRASDVRRPKAVVLAERIAESCPQIAVRPLLRDVRWDFGTTLFGQYDVILLATHDYSSRLHVNRFAHRFPGRLRALISGAIGPLALSVQTVIPGEPPCYACGLPPDVVDSGGGVGCNGIVGDRASAPAATNGMDGLAAAALMAKEAVLVLAGLAPMFVGRELVMNAGTGTVVVYDIPRRQSCTDHLPARDDEILRLPCAPGTSVTHLRRAIAARCDCHEDDVRLRSSLLLVTDIVCECGSAQRIMRPQASVIRTTCPACGNVDSDRFRAEFAFEIIERGDAVSLADWGIPLGQALEVQIGPARRIVIPVDGFPPEDPEARSVSPGRDASLGGEGLV